MKFFVCRNYLPDNILFVYTIFSDSDEAVVTEKCISTNVIPSDH